MRELTDHKVNGLNEHLTIMVEDEPGPGGANHSYLISARDEGFGMDTPAKFHVRIQFQNGPLKENAVNGISQEALLAILIDRLRGFQSGQFDCRENALALTKLEEANMWLQKRTRDRMTRGVEGTNKK